MTADTTPRSWSLESRELAIKKAYLDGQLKGAVDGNSAPSLPADYLANAKQVAEKQGALAGYRLADEIREYLKWTSDLPWLPENTNAATVVLPAKIGTADASKYYEESMIVTGKVVQVSEHPTVTILDIDRPNPDTPFTAIIFSENSGAFGDLNKLQNQSVEISGDITEYHGRPEIILESTNQIKMVEGK
jgi:hypothetical protein